MTDAELPRLTNSPVAPETARGRRVALTVLLVATFLTVAWVASSLWVGILFGTVMAFTAQPVYRHLAQRFGARRKLAATLTTVLYGLVTAAIGVFAAWIIARELMLLLDFLQQKLAAGSVVDLVGERGLRVLERFQLDQAAVDAKLRQEIAAASSYAAAALGLLLQTTTGAVVGLIIALVTMYYVLLEWPSIAMRLERVLPLDPRHTRALMLEFRDVGRSAFLGAIATAVVQGAFGGVGYAIVSVPQPVTWAVLTAFVSFVPIVGTALVYVPIAIWLLMNGHPVAAVFLIAWGLLVIMALTDYVIRPWLVGAKGHAHPLLTLVALVGGVEVLGLPGLIVAPILMSLFLAVLRIYERETSLL